MKNKNVILLSAVAVLVLASLACSAVTTGGGNGGSDEATAPANDNSGFSFTTANIKDAHLARDAGDTDHTTVFSPSDNIFYCFFSLKNAPDTTVVRGEWILVSADGYESNSPIDQLELTSGDDNIYFSLEKDSSLDGWPVGKYKIDLYIDDNLVQTLNFEVQ